MLAGHPAEGPDSNRQAGPAGSRRSARAGHHPPRHQGVRPACLQGHVCSSNPEHLRVKSQQLLFRQPVQKTCRQGLLRTCPCPRSARATASMQMGLQLPSEARTIPKDKCTCPAWIPRPCGVPGMPMHGHRCVCSQASNILVHKQGYVQLADLGVASVQQRLVSSRSLNPASPLGDDSQVPAEQERCSGDPSVPGTGQVCMYAGSCSLSASMTAVTVRAAAGLLLVLLSSLCACWAHASRSSLTTAAAPSNPPESWPGVSCAIEVAPTRTNHLS